MESRSLGSVMAVLLLLIPARVASSQGLSFTAFGPETYARATGAPSTEQATFAVLNPNAAYILRAVPPERRVAGAETAPGRSSDRSESAVMGTISVNGVPVVTPDDFSRTTLIEKPVALQATNLLEVRLRSAPGTTLTVEIIGMDPDPPTITATASPAPNGAGWNRSPVTVTFECGDQTSGIASCPAPVVVDVEGANQTVTGTAVDEAGNTASASATVNLDLTPPAIVASPSPAPNAAGWNRSDVTVAFDCADPLSGFSGGLSDSVHARGSWGRSFGTGDEGLVATRRLVLVRRFLPVRRDRRDTFPPTPLPPTLSPSAGDSPPGPGLGVEISCRV
jgi:hypothetical protein